MKSDIKKMLLIIPYVLFLSLENILLPEVLDMAPEIILWEDIFGQVSAGEIQSIVMSIESLGAIFLFDLLCGNNIARHFVSVGTMLFTRIHDRRIWAFKKTAQICGLSVFYTALFLGIKLLISVRQSADGLMSSSVFLVVMILFGLLVPLLVSVCLMTNLLSLRHGIPFSIFSSFLLVIVLEFFAILYFDHQANMILNPLCFNIQMINSMPLACSKIIVEWIYLTAIACGTAFYIERMDILNS